MLIAIDASTVKTGFAFGGVNDGVPRGGVWKGQGADELVFDRTLAGMSESVSQLVRLIKAEWVAIEAPLLINDSNHAAHTAMALIQLTGALRAASKRAGAQVMLVAISTVRKHFVGHGYPKNPKEAVMARCRQLGWQPEDDNVGDAMALWSYAMAIKCPRWAPRSTPLFADARRA